MNNYINIKYIVNKYEICKLMIYIVHLVKSALSYNVPGIKSVYLPFGPG